LLEPDYVKLDPSLVRGVGASTRKQSIIRAMLRLCHKELGIQVICEGVETDDEREALTTAGAQLMQGFLFAKPASTLPDVRW
jgi:EAL domain-containing protein (putative c-di-GMP-specific phosphodiesterase class I)